MKIAAMAPRAVRAALFTALVVTLSAGSHVLLARAALPIGTVAAVAGAVFVLAFALAGRERGYWRIAALLVPLELAADTVFTTGQHLCYGQAGGPVAGPLRSLGFDVLCGGEVGASLARAAGGAQRPATELLAGAESGASWVLLAAHIGIGLAAAAWLRHGERAVAAMLRAATALAFRPLLLAVAVVSALPERPRRLPRPGRSGRGARVRLLVHSVARRGPPRSVLA